MTLGTRVAGLRDPFILQGSVRTSLLVGTALALITTPWRGHAGFSAVARVVLVYLVPFLVASWGLTGTDAIYHPGEAAPHDGEYRCETCRATFGHARRHFRKGEIFPGCRQPHRRTRWSLTRTEIERSTQP